MDGWMWYIPHTRGGHHDRGTTRDEELVGTQEGQAEWETNVGRIDELRTSATVPQLTGNQGAVQTDLRRHRGTARYRSNLRHANHIGRSARQGHDGNLEDGPKSSFHTAEIEGYFSTLDDN